MKKKISLLLITSLVGLSFAQPSFAFLGFGDIVFDPTVYAEAVQHLIQLQQQYVQLVQTYQTVRSQYEEALRMARSVPVDMAARYRAEATAWKPSSAANTYGTTEGWVTGINTGRDAASGYWQASQPLEDYGNAIGNIPADQIPRVKTSYATVELTDGANIAAIDTIGRMRAVSGDVEKAIQGLEEDSLSSAPDMNTQIAVLNKINAANLIAVRAGQDTNQLLVTLAEQQILDSKRKRDAEAQAIHNHIRFVSEGRSVIAAQSADASAAMRAWRMP